MSYSAKKHIKNVTNLTKLLQKSQRLNSSGVEELPIYSWGEPISGVVHINLHPGKKVEHSGNVIRSTFFLAAILIKGIIFFRVLFSSS